MSNFYQWLPTLGSRAISQTSDAAPEHLLYFYAKMFNISIDTISDDPKIVRDSEYVKLKQDFGFGPLGGYEIS